MSPRYTIIIPVGRFSNEEPVLTRLREVAPATGMQILVAIGSHPARQRNAALAEARGEIVVFLDNDCSVEAEFWNELERDFARPEVEVVGGPALLRPEAAGPERIFHALLTHPLVVGPVCARYAARGIFRSASQTELILCNLAARRAVFAKIGLLPVELYPNEENEWLDRAQAAGVGIYYDPGLQVFRPQRQSWSEMARMLVRYGMGRTKQLQISGWHFTAHQFAPLVLLLPVAALYGGTHAEAAFGIGWLILAFLVALTCGSGLRLRQRLLAGLVAPLVPFLYALGQMLGWFRLGVPSPGSTAGIRVVNEKGENPDS